jgi:hydroxymethylpyrimidine/phosphomethylpyrimidine kinase
MSMPIALTISSSDSGGGAGIQGDLKTFEALGVFGTSVVTAVGAQNTLGLGSVLEVPAPLVKEQLRAVLSDLLPAAIKIGTVSSTPAIRGLASLLAGLMIPIVLDPALVGRRGPKALRSTALNSLIRELLPLVTIITPNLPEASLLAGFAIRNEADAKRAARAIQTLGPAAVLIKGGHGEGAQIADGLLDGRTWHVFHHPRIDTPHTHGVGCALSSAIAAWLARGETLPEAVAHGLDFVQRALLAAPRLGSGSGPLGHRAAGG